MKPMRARLDKNGRIVLPAACRKALGLHPGDVVTIRVEDCEARVVPLDESIRRVQAIVRQHFGPGRSLSDELIAERRAEAERE